jgi:ribonuclease D
MERRYVDTAAGLLQLCQDLTSADHLALDTEFLREKTYYPKLCLLQVCADGIAACVDPLAIRDLGPLLSLLADPARVKVWHSARQDLEIFHHDWNLLPAPVFDTQLAAAVLGLGDQVGYARLVQDVLGRELPKDQSRSDWCRRPLDDIQLRYAYDDVIHLDALYVDLAGRLERLGRSAWLSEDFGELLDPGTYRTEPTDAWRRIKGRQQLRGAKLAVLQQLAAWREDRAMNRDRPRRWILKDEVLVDLARRPPDTIAALGRIRGLDERQIAQVGKAILEAVARGLALPRDQWPKETIPPRLSAAREATVDLLGAVVRLIADANSITPAALCSRSDLSRLVAGADSPLDHGWRRALAGDPLREVLAGKRVVRVHDGAAVLESWQG